MRQIARSWRVAVAGLAVGVAGVLGFAGATASAEPVLPPRPNPAPAPGPVGNSVPGTAPVAPSPISSPPAPARSAVSPTQPTLLPATSGTIRDYFQAKNVQLQAQQPQNFKALDITLPMPPGWTQVPDPNVADPFVVTADRSSNSLYTSNAQVVVYKLIGDLDPREAITHGYVDSQQQPAWRSTNASMADFGGFPSSIIEGTYRQNDMTLNASRRHVIATSGPDRYLVSLAVTTDAGQAVAAAPATDAIVNGFRVNVPTANPPAAAPTPAMPAAPTLAPLPARPAAPAH